MFSYLLLTLVSSIVLFFTCLDFPNPVLEWKSDSELKNQVFLLFILHFVVFGLVGKGSEMDYAHMKLKRAE